MMPMDFSDPNFLVHRATRIWSWRFPNKGESQEEYREAFAKYVGLSDPDEAEAVRKSAVFTKFDPTPEFKKGTTDADGFSGHGEPDATGKGAKVSGAKPRRERRAVPHRLR